MHTGVNIKELARHQARVELHEVKSLGYRLGYRLGYSVRTGYDSFTGVNVFVGAWDAKASLGIEFEASRFCL